MRFQGTLTNWNDDRGFGFIKPDGGGQDVFVNIKAFGRGAVRPSNGARLSFEVEQASDGKKRAGRVDFLQAPKAASAGDHRPRSEASRRVHSNAKGPSWPVLSLLSFAALPVVFLVSSVLWGVSWYVLLAYAMLSVFTFLMYADDKDAAMKGKWRASEGGLLMLGLLGGWPGANVAQHYLRHKSKKADFRFLHWLTVLGNLGGLAFVSSQGMLRPEAWL